MEKIKFSHLYFKMPRCIWLGEKSETYLIGVSIVPDIHKLPKEFLDWDTGYPDKTEIEPGKISSYGKSHYKLFDGRGILLTLFTIQKEEDMLSLVPEAGAYIWTTARRWTPDKEPYYLNLIGEQVKIVIEKK